ncbi:LOW QUALITY PROTEIN: uncharacterized protein LOC105214607 [Zeugodacus cucurbitae]|nr:LOW QUALITY PROTEIN: uncharacterized protein LOC105214607 [Zeugodacus cucurbitae]
MKYEDINCTSESIPTPTRTGRHCGDGVLLPFVNQFEDGEITTMEVCFDEDDLKTYYVEHIIYPGTKHGKRGVPRPNFIQQDFFRGVKVDNCYKTQFETISRILGKNASEYITTQNRLTRGHLAAKADLAYSGQQIATCKYLNSAPQWPITMTRLCCWTGTWGICTLPNDKGVQKDLYIDEQNNNTIPVPKLFFRIVIDSVTLKGIVLVGVNNPYLTDKEVKAGGFVVAKNISNDIECINWAKKIIEKGYCYACSVPDFIAVVKDLPHNDLSTTGILDMKLPSKEQKMGSNSIFTILIWIVIYIVIILLVHQPDAQNVNIKPNNLQINNIINGPEQSGVAVNLKLPEETIINSFNKYDKNECAPCVIKVNGHMTDKSPLLTQPNKLAYMQPNKSGEIVIPYGGWVDLRCGDAFVNTCVQILKAQCDGDQNFRINQEVVKYEKINCTSVSRPIPTRTGRGDGELLTFANHFEDGEICTMQVCFDKINLKTYYVAHTIYAGTKHRKLKVPRTNFSQEDFFPGVNVDHCYKQKTQIETLSRILGVDASIYITTKNYLSRGHLAAKADQIFSGQQKSTFHFLNAAPQWQSFNGGNWSTIEDDVREYANNNGTTLLCWTGILGICTLPDVDGVQQPLHLHIDEQNNHTIPVPKLFFRIVIDSESRKGIVLVGVNNPYLTLEEVRTGAYMVAEDLSDQVTWIQWDRQNVNKGYCYACSVPNFTAIVKNLPHDDLKTTGVLGLKELSKMYAHATTTVKTPSTSRERITKTTKQPMRSALNIYILFGVFVCVVGREAVKPADDVALILKRVEAGDTTEENAPVHNNNARPCTIDTQYDLPKPNLPQPLYIRPNSTEYWLPNDDGFIEVPQGSSIELICTASFANATAKATGISRKTRVIRPRCHQGTTFTLNGEKYEFRQFLCTQPVKYTVERTAQACANNTAQLYRVGYNLTRTRFLETMQICHDDDELRTHYVRYTLQPANQYYQPGVKRLSFSKAKHFTQYDMNYFYSQNNQQLQAAQLLGSEDQAQTCFDKKSLFLSRGHLAAKADMIYATQQRTTYTFFNAAPQWQSFNGGQWATLEERVRAFVKQSKQTVTCYTGTVGTMQLRNTSGDKRQPYYLAYDKNNNGLLPVPALYFRIIVTATGRAGIVLLGSNDPFATLREIHEEYVICTDVREHVPWLKWMKNRVDDSKGGYMYACRVDEFSKVVPTLTAELANVSELLV